MYYNYIEAMKNDIKDYIKEWLDLENYIDREDLEDDLNDRLFVSDSVTGNASGSYTFNSYTAKEYVMSNIEICKEALCEFCIESETVADKFLGGEWEYFDVTIRCYLLGQAISETLDELEEAEKLPY